MSETAKEQELLQLKLNIYHKDCWTLKITEENPGKLLGLGVSVQPNGLTGGRFAVLGETVAEVDSLINAARNSTLTTDVQELPASKSVDRMLPPGIPTREIYVEYKSKNSINHQLSAQGFILNQPNIIRDGQEIWNVVIRISRLGLKRRLDEIREEMDAEITIKKITAKGQEGGTRTDGICRLSERQREIFEFARSHDYYTWPRETTAKELAHKRDISKTTFLEHLRKAEAKLLDPK